MTYRVFIPSESLVKTARWTLQALATICAVTACALVLIGALHVMAWLCSSLIVVIHAMASVCHEAIAAIGGSPENVVVVCIVWLLLVLSVKATCILFSSFFQAEGARA